jgi:hypothetical protein
VGDTEVDLELDEFACELTQTLVVSLGPSILNREIAALDPAESLPDVVQGFLVRIVLRFPITPPRFAK